jgi:putative ABC transport system substrate-binding protein
MIPLGTKMAISIGRREFMAALGGAATAWPLPARAQQQAMTRVGIVTIQPRTAPMYAAFDQRLRELGYVEGQNLALDYVNPEHRGIAGAIEELLRRKVDIILVTYESTLKAALAARVTVPIVMVAVDYDPLALGYVKSLARPGDNVTGPLPATVGPCQKARRAFDAGREHFSSLIELHPILHGPGAPCRISK